MTAVQQQHVASALPLHESLEQTVQHVRAEAHQSHVLRRAVLTLAVHDGSLKHVAELSLRAEEVGPHEVDHAPVLEQVVLQRVARQHHATPVTTARRQCKTVISCE